MAKLKFKQDFELEVGDDVYIGTLKDLTKAERKQFEEDNKSRKDDNNKLQKLLKQIKKTKRKIEVSEKLEQWDKVDTLENKLDDLEASFEELSEKIENPAYIEEMFKLRIKMSVESKDKEKILSIGEQYGYQKVFNTILEDVSEKARGK